MDEMWAMAESRCDRWTWPNDPHFLSLLFALFQTCPLETWPAPEARSRKEGKRVEKDETKMEGETCSGQGINYETFDVIPVKGGKGKSLSLSSTVQSLFVSFWPSGGIQPLPIPSSYSLPLNLLPSFPFAGSSLTDDWLSISARDSIHYIRVIYLHQTDG